MVLEVLGLSVGRAIPAVYIKWPTYPRDLQFVWRSYQNKSSSCK